MDTQTAEFNAPSDMRYVRFLKQLHQANLFDWYMEVGCRTGRSFAEVRGKTIGVDPFFRVASNVIGAKPALLLFQQTSDDFFGSGMLEALNVRLGFSFLDGMHLFEHLLRDFANTEAASDPAGVIALHDCCPFSHEMTTRDLNNLPTDAWTGDVWKLIPILQNYRPDLKIDVLGCKPTGLVMVSGLDPRNTVLIDRYDEILHEWQTIELRDYGADRFYGAFEYTTVAEIMQDDWAYFSGVRLPQRAALTPEYVTP